MRPIDLPPTPNLSRDTGVAASSSWRSTGKPAEAGTLMLVHSGSDLDVSWRPHRRRGGDGPHPDIREDMDVIGVGFSGLRTLHQDLPSDAQVLVPGSTLPWG